MTPFDCSQPLVLDTICYLGLQKDSTQNPSYPQISRRPKIIHIYLSVYECVYGMVWYGMVWYGMVWYGMVWYGMVWYGMVWYGIV